MTKLKAARLAANLTQHELAEVTGMTSVSICRYENGKRKISVDKAKLLAKALDVSWTSLFDDDNPEEK